MASALLASRNEPYWGEAKVYMRKNPNPNPNRLCPYPNPSLVQIPNDHASELRHAYVHPVDSDEPAGPASDDDCSSFSRMPVPDLARRRDGGYVTFNISAYSKRELRELKRRLMSELDQVRAVSSRIESGEIPASARSAAYSSSLGAYAGGREVTSSATPPAVHRSDKRPAAAVMTMAASTELRKAHSAMMRKCGQILTKLMKHKGGIWFNVPVDVEGMGLHDYYQVVKTPMDLGTVKMKHGKGCYSNPLDFADDITLTFRNALRYNPEGHEVYRYADILLKQFEGSFRSAYSRYEKQKSNIEREEEKRRQMSSSWAPVAPMPRAEPALPMSPPATHSQVLSRPLPPSMAQMSPKPQPQQQQQQQQQQQKEEPAMRQPKQLPKPKVGDPNKRDMSMAEKKKLGAALQDLPDRKMNELLNIISKRNVTAQNGDELEIDLELMDNETLWELDRFVINWHKTLSKMKRRQEMMASGNGGFPDPSLDPAPPAHLPSDAGNKTPQPAAEMPEAAAAKKMKKGDPVDEDVDIGEEMPATHYPSVEIEKESSSSSSGSDSSSSSDSDSGSSSGSDSDDDDDDGAAASRRSPRS